MTSAADSILWVNATLRAARDVARGIRLFELLPDTRLPAPTPGCHVSVEVDIGGRRDVRSYSVVGPCGGGVIQIAVKRVAPSRGGSAYMWQLAAGARLRMSAPRNLFALNQHESDYLLVAGGIGITPIFSMALFLAANTARLRVLYAAQSADDLAMLDQLQPALGDRLSLLLDQRGERVNFAAEIDRLAPDGEMYVCGPLGMLEAAKRAWRASGRPTERLRFETFGNSGHAPAQSFRINIPRLGRELEVAANQTMLDALQAAGIEMIFDCRRGECGLCALPILSVDGVVDHRDVFFSDAEAATNAKICTCVSRISGVSITIDTADRLA